MKQKVLKVVNALLFLSLLAQTATLVIRWFARIGWVWEIHEINGYVLVGLAILHFILNWTWIKTNVFKRGKS